MPLDDVRQIFGGIESIGARARERSADAEVRSPDARGAPCRARDREDQTSSRKPLVLVVEDDTDTAELISEILQDHGCDVIVCNDGLSALEAVREIPAPDLVLLDLELPAMSGRDVLREMKRDIAVSWIPVVVVSSAPDATTIYASDNIAKKDILHGLARVLDRLNVTPPRRVSC
jgi:CheY-like chemotaxis protein